MNIVIGQYFPIKSIIHSLDPRLKLIATFALIVVLFIVSTPLSYVLIFLLVFSVVILSKVPFMYLLKGLRAILFIMLFSVVLNMFFTQGNDILFQYSFIKVTYQGFYMAVKMASRLILLVIISSILTLTTSPIELTDAIEYLLNPFKKIGVPAHEIAMMMTISLRFIPTLIEEAQKIMEAQTARGADFETGGIIKRAKALIPLLVPLFISAFRRAEDLALAMESRCYRGDIHRTRMKQLLFSKLDLLAMFTLIVYFSLVVFLDMAKIS